jgi:hypothetical protein
MSELLLFQTLRRSGPANGGWPLVGRKVTALIWPGHPLWRGVCQVAGYF